jgi:hypothetical protein
VVPIQWDMGSFLAREFSRGRLKKKIAMHHGARNRTRGQI